MAKKTYYYIVDDGTRVTPSTTPPSRQRQDWVPTSKQVYRQYKAGRREYVERWHAEASQKRERRANWKKKKFEEYYGADTQKRPEYAKNIKNWDRLSYSARKRVYEAAKGRRQKQSKVKSKVVTDAQGRPVAILGHPEKTYEERVKAQKKRRMDDRSTLDPAIQKRIYGEVVQRGPQYKKESDYSKSASLFLSQGRRARAFVSEQEQIRKYKKKHGIGRTTAETELIQKHRRLRQLAKEDKITPEQFKIEFEQIGDEYKRKYQARQARIFKEGEVEEDLKKLQERQREHEVRTERVMDRAGRMTLSQGVPYEERSLPGQIAQTTAFMYTGYAPLAGAVMVAADKTWFQMKHKDYLDMQGSGAEAARKEAQQASLDAINPKKDPALYVATGITLSPIAMGAGAGTAGRVKPDLRVSGVMRGGKFYGDLRAWRMPEAGEAGARAGEAGARAGEAGARAGARVVDAKPRGGSWDFVRRTTRRGKDRVKSMKDRLKERFRRQKDTRDIAKQEPKRPAMAEPKPPARYRGGRIKPYVGEVWRPPKPSGRSIKPWREKPVERVTDIRVRDEVRDLKPRDEVRDLKPRDEVRDIRVRDEVRDLKPRDTLRERSRVKTTDPYRGGRGWRMPFIPPFGGLDLSFGGGGGILGGKSRWPTRAKKRAKKGYLPSQIALTFNIRGKKPKKGTGLEFRPIPMKW